ncbi:MAG TPA: hypothetical protein PKD54_03715 [Pirellulaceae bacterium]|nr:hypothetical protein [Pirellulaceae bacterium]
MVLLMTICGGCGTVTSRMATEQLLMSDAVDNSVARIDFRPISGKKVFLDTTYLRPAQGQNFVNADYVISSLRQALVASRCLLQDDRQEADIIVEPRLGTLATNGNDMIYGIPATNNLTQAASSVAGGALLPPLPEIALARSSNQSGFTKVAVFAYDRQTRQPVWQSGISKAESTARSTWLLGAGPFTRGTIFDGYRFAESNLTKSDSELTEYDRPIPFTTEHFFGFSEVPSARSAEVPQDTQPR